MEGRISRSVSDRIVGPGRVWRKRASEARVVALQALLTRSLKVRVSVGRSGSWMLMEEEMDILEVLQPPHEVDGFEGLRFIHGDNFKGFGSSTT